MPQEESDKVKFNLEGVPDEFSTVKDEINGDQVHPVTAALIWASITIGMDEIAEHNYREWFQRIKAMEIVDDYFLIYSPERGIKFNPTLQDIKDRIGLTTNAARLDHMQFLDGLKNKIWGMTKLFLKQAEASADEDKTKAGSGKTRIKIRPKPEA